jgi:hypothetical protein
VIRTFGSDGTNHQGILSAMPKPSAWGLWTRNWSQIFEPNGPPKRVTPEPNVAPAASRPAATQNSRMISCFFIWMKERLPISMNRMMVTHSAAPAMLAPLIRPM